MENKIAYATKTDVHLLTISNEKKLYKLFQIYMFRFSNKDLLDQEMNSKIEEKEKTKTLGILPDYVTKTLGKKKDFFLKNGYWKNY